MKKPIALLKNRLLKKVKLKSLNNVKSLGKVLIYLRNKHLAQGALFLDSAEVSCLQNYVWWVAPWGRKKLKETGEDPTESEQHV